MGECFPLGRGLEKVDLGNEPQSGSDTRPFGLRYLTPVNLDDANVLDITGVAYCPQIQTSTIGERPFILAATKATVATPYDTVEDNQTFRDQSPDAVPD